MHRKIILTSDGSHSIEIPGLNVTYHSIHGAVQESRHVFIEAGLHKLLDNQPPKVARILEVGFGTGLNVLLSLIESEKFQQAIYYETIESFPLDIAQIKLLNYCKQLHRGDLQKTFEGLHNCEWEKEITLTEKFIFKKIQNNLLDFETSETFGLVYFDAFDPDTQPELWTEGIFRKMFSILQPGGVLTTYSSKGSVRRAMQAAGFAVEKIPGPPGKREIVRATKI